MKKRKDSFVQEMISLAKTNEKEFERKLGALVRETEREVQLKIADVLLNLAK